MVFPSARMQKETRQETAGGVIYMVGARRCARGGGGGMHYLIEMMC